MEVNKLLYILEQLCLVHETIPCPQLRENARYSQLLMQVVTLDLFDALYNEMVQTESSN